MALAATVLAGLAFRKQSQEVGILLEENKREAAERRMAQASQVFIWTETTDEPVIDGVQRQIGPHVAIVAHLKNTSQQPVYDLDISGSWSYPAGISR